MKKSWVVLLICLLLLPLLPAQALSLFDIRQQAQIGWHQRYQVKGRDIEIDLSPSLPDVAQLPVLEVIPMPPIPDAIFRQEVPHWKNPGDGRNDPGSLVVAASTQTLSGELAKHHDYPIQLLPLAGLDKAQVLAEDSRTSLKEADDFFQWKLHAFYGPAVQAVLDEARQLDRPRPYDDQHEAFTGDSPQPGTTGSFRLLYHQLLRGIPVLYPFQSRIWYATPANYSSLVFELRQETGVRHPDLPLCPFSHITGALEALIQQNKLQHISRLSLGYVVFGKPREAGLAMPYWVADALRITQTRAGEHRLPLTIIIHPQTGEARIQEDESTPLTHIIPHFAP